MPLGDAGVALGDDEDVGIGGPDLLHRLLGVDQIGPAVGSNGVESEPGGQLGRLDAGDPHHRPTRGVETHGQADREVADLAGALDGGLGLLQRAHRLDPQHVGPAGSQALGLFGEGGGAALRGHRAHRLEQLAGRPHRAGDQHQAIGVGGHGRVGHVTGERGRGLVELVDLIVELVQGQSEVGPSEAVGEEQIAARVDVGRVGRADLVRLVAVPGLWRIARTQSSTEQLGAGGSIGEGEALSGHEVVQNGHGVCLPVQARWLSHPIPAALWRFS